MIEKNFSRRQAGRLGLAAAISPMLGHLALAADESGKPAAGKIGDFKISLAQWSLHKRLFADRSKTTAMNLDFPKMAKVEFGIDGVEYVNQFFKDKARDEAYLKELNKRAADHGVTNVLIMIDGEGDLSVEDATKRNQAVENHMKWVDAAAALGCHAIRINTGSNYSATKTNPAAEACRKLADYGEKHKIEIICENHGGPSSDPDSLIALIKAVGSKNFGTLPDFGNFPRDKNKKHTIDIYQAIARLMPYAKGVSAKSYVFDQAGNERDMDFGRIMKIVSDAGYKSWVGIEYEGSELGEPEGITATKKLLEKLRGSEYKV
ncbi:MAG: sugar phosphate isomerase/epimerase family protein [bacterium]